MFTVTYFMSLPYVYKCVMCMCMINKYSMIKNIKTYLFIKYNIIYCHFSGLKQGKSFGGLNFKINRQRFTLTENDNKDFYLL